MTIKTLFVAIGISVSAFSVAGTVDVAVEDNLELKRLVSAYSDASNIKTMMDLCSYLKSSQSEIYDLVDSGKLFEAISKFESIIELLAPIYESLSDEDRLSAGLETLGLINEYLVMHVSESESPRFTFSADAIAGVSKDLEDLRQIVIGSFAMLRRRLMAHPPDLDSV
ncbi:MAG: hypothetical protein Q8Q56_05695 [Alphaproteobacteria bacterium]|nr:hypothetical protein [Alphaproteobacteria bacterium]